MSSEYIEGLKKAIELIEHSSEADDLSLKGQWLSHAKASLKYAIQLINDEIQMEGGQ